jgi:hypothetical protein
MMTTCHTNIFFSSSKLCIYQSKNVESSYSTILKQRLIMASLQEAGVDLHRWPQVLISETIWILICFNFLQNNYSKRMYLYCDTINTPHIFVTSFDTERISRRKCNLQSTGPYCQISRNTFCTQNNNLDSSNVNCKVEKNYFDAVDTL